jgi:hypothetical protein
VLRNADRAELRRLLESIPPASWPSLIRMQREWRQPSIDFLTTTWEWAQREQSDA